MTPMHRIQQHILQQLILSPSSNYARIKPVEIEGNLFMYHLRRLMKLGLVIKRADGLYELSLEGQEYSERLSLKTLLPRSQPRIVTLIMCHRDNDEYVLFRRHRQPLHGMVGFPYGKLHLGETVLEAANRELEDKAGLSATLCHRGDGYATMYRDHQVVSQIFFHLYVGLNPKGDLRTQNPIGEAFWSRIEAVPDAVLMPSVRDIIALDESTATNERFFAELVYDLDK